MYETQLVRPVVDAEENNIAGVADGDENDYQAPDGSLASQSIHESLMSQSIDLENDEDKKDTLDKQYVNVQTSDPAMKNLEGFAKDITEHPQGNIAIEAAKEDDNITEESRCIGYSLTKIAPNPNLYDDGRKTYDVGSNNIVRRRMEVKKSQLPWYLRMTRLKRRKCPPHFKRPRCNVCKRQRPCKTKDSKMHTKFWIHKKNRSHLCYCVDCKNSDSMNKASKYLKKMKDKPRFIRNHLNNHELLDVSGEICGVADAVPRLPRTIRNPKIPNIPEFDIADMRILVHKDYAELGAKGLKEALQESDASSDDTARPEEKDDADDNAEDNGNVDEKDSNKCLKSVSKHGAENENENKPDSKSERNEANLPSAESSSFDSNCMADIKRIVAKKMEDEERPRIVLEGIININDPNVEEWVQETIDTRVFDCNEERKNYFDMPWVYNSYSAADAKRYKERTRKPSLSYGMIHEEKHAVSKTSRIGLNMKAEQLKPINKRHAVFGNLRSDNSHLDPSCCDDTLCMTLPMLQSEYPIQRTPELGTSPEADAFSTVADKRTPRVMSLPELKSEDFVRNTPEVRAKSLADLRKATTILPSLPQINTAPKPPKFPFGRPMCEHRKDTLDVDEKIKRILDGLPKPGQLTYTMSKKVNGMLREQYLEREKAKTEQKIAELRKQLDDMKKRSSDISTGPWSKE